MANEFLIGRTRILPAERNLTFTNIVRSRMGKKTPLANSRHTLENRVPLNNSERQMASPISYTDGFLVAELPRSEQDKAMRVLVNRFIIFGGVSHQRLIRRDHSGLGCAHDLLTGGAVQSACKENRIATPTEHYSDVSWGAAHGRSVIVDEPTPVTHEFRVCGWQFENIGSCVAVRIRLGMLSTRQDQTR